MSMEAVFSAVGGVIILHETLSVREWVGCGIMLLTLLCPTGEPVKREPVRPPETSIPRRDAAGVPALFWQRGTFSHILQAMDARQPLLQILIPQGLSWCGWMMDVVAGLIVKDHLLILLYSQIPAPRTHILLGRSAGSHLPDP